MLWAALTLAACGRQTPAAQPTATPAQSAAAEQPARPRIVSTVPAATLNLVLIGAADELVGVSKYDVSYLPAAQKNLPVVGDYETMNYEELVKLKPTVLVIQTVESPFQRGSRKPPPKNTSNWSTCTSITSPTYGPA